MFINYLKYKLIYFFNYFNTGSTLDDFEKSNRKALNMNWRNQKPNPEGKYIYITYRNKTMRTYCNPRGQLFPKGWPTTQTELKVL